jgi:membrane protease YdiL (CAAX protease family)
LATGTQRIPRAFTRADGRERIAVPIGNGILSTLGAIAIGFLVMFVAMIVLMVAAILTTGKMPSTNPGHPLLAVAEVVFYAAGGWFAWWRLRAMGKHVFRTLTRHDVRAILIGIAALFVLRFGTGVLLVLTDQTKHVQSGFEHFDVKTTVPAITTLSTGLAILTLVFIGPIVEELVFRGLLLGALASRLGVLASALITALLFGAVHGDLVLFPSLAALGLVAAFAYAGTGNLWVSIILHALNNSLGAAVLIATSLNKH